MAARKDIPSRVRRVADRALADQRYVRPIDVLLGLGWLAPSAEDRWRQGRLRSLLEAVQVDPGKVATAITEFAASRTPYDRRVRPVARR